MKNLPEAVATDSCMMIIVLCMMFPFILKRSFNKFTREISLEEHGILFFGLKEKDVQLADVNLLGSARVVSRNRPRKKGGAKRVREPRYAIKTRTDVDIMDDGFKWRKYGQKAVKNSPHPRYQDQSMHLSAG
jgi:hypothetical protein